MKATLAKLPLFALSVVGCASQSSTDIATSDVVTPSCPSGDTEIAKSLAITDAKALANFPFARTLGQVLASSGAAPAETTGQLFDQWMSTFGPSDCTNPSVDPHHYGEVCPRTPEAKLATVDPTDPASLVQFEPVGLFNRFDLAPKNGATCGEYRIVYAMHSTQPGLGGRGFIIFEAAMPNPQPQNKLAGCLPIAEFWQNLSQLSEKARNQALVDFYYNGTAIAGVPAVVDAAHYGLLTNGAYTAGQIRTNMFIDDAQWNLREFKTDVSCAGSADACTLAIDHVTVKENPANELFDGTAKAAGKFLAAFPQQVGALSATSVPTIGMAIDDQYDEYESVASLSRDVDYDQFTDGALTAAITAQITAPDLAAGDILRRATTQTCAGCHEISTFGSESTLDGDPSLTWPKSRGFVQIDEHSAMSDALTSFFLPNRQGVLDTFIANQCAGVTATDPDDGDGLTVGGSVVGADN
jgi:hypothetical protein|nr:hypothetical protein [Kofleriaceae bacterium]